MVVTRLDNGDVGNYKEFYTRKVDIKEVADEFGRSNDTVELLTDDRKLVARAIWPIGSKRYLYSVGKNLDANPAYCIYDG